MHDVKLLAQIWAVLWYLIFEKLLKVNNRPNGKKIVQSGHPVITKKRTL
jgi:hypothetical protein